MAQTSTAEAVWTGDLKSGQGELSTGSGDIKAAGYDFARRFEGAPGLNPEELVGAALAGCYSMALSGDLGQAGMTPERVETKATVTLDRVDGKPTVTRVHLEVAVAVPGADRQKVMEAAEAAKAGCPISRLLNAEITMEATLS